MAKNDLRSLGFPEACIKEVEAYHKKLAAYRATLPPPVIHQSLALEKKAHHGTCKCCGAPQDKYTSSYDFALLNVKHDGYNRFLRPAEAAHLAGSLLKGELSDVVKEAADDLFTDAPEFVSAAIEKQTTGFFRKKKMLTLYLDPDLFFHKDSYSWMYCPQKASHRFDITGRGNGLSIPVHELPESLHRLLYGCTFDDIPQEMCDAFVLLPYEGELSPLVFGGDGNDRYWMRSAVGVASIMRAAYRGVRDTKTI
ncbi:hypothetical protein HY639_04940 [Candidatus Woesearchaeota archaeon]|nr:hypothetical protein [Candidatus Woesearchaeota archaeon]